ncbi:MAG: alpha/beta fold hydrolase [Candidatus Margulisiibacteriota bacterium]|nr:alpha/beta fold hydrolase [Candidatus Margulisiibacteriota bacterium]
MGVPIIFVHGVGASAAQWGKFNIPGHPLFYISFLNRFDNPSNQALELGKYINDVLIKTKQERVILVCHSMGGLVARKYLTDNTNAHRVEKMVLLSTPNIGTIGLTFNWLPLILIIFGALGYKFIWPLIICLAGLLYEIISYLRGVLLLSPAAWAMRKNSRFIRKLNLKKMPEDVKYVSVLSDTRVFPHRLVNIFLFREGGDGAIPVGSQKLSAKSVPNFSRINYSEHKIDLPHFAVPRKINPQLLIDCIGN